MSEQLRPEGRDESQLARFRAIVEPLEVESRQALSGRGLTDCQRAFSENALGFEAAADRASEKQRLGKVRRSLPILVLMVRDGEHRIPTTRGGSDDGRFASYDA